MTETIDIFDANLRKLGTMERAQAHLKGEWHMTFHCWVINLALNGGSVLFQLRSSTMVNFPNLLDVSAAGHLEAGEKVEDGIREVTEELGISVNTIDLLSLGYRVEVADQTNGQRNREYQSVYFLHLDSGLADYRADPEEIAGLFWLPIDRGLQLFNEGGTSAEMVGVRYDRYKKQWIDEHRSVTQADFLPRIQRYYLTVMIMAERLRCGQMPLAIS